MNNLSYPDGLYQYILKMCAFHPVNIVAGFYYGNKIGGTMGDNVDGKFSELLARPVKKIGAASVRHGYGIYFGALSHLFVFEDHK